MKTSHTPGPWICHSGMVWKDGPNVYPKGDNDGIPICRMDREYNNGTIPVERDANARLIAAAPDMLEALERLIANNGTGAMEWAINNARQAIAKAKGE